MIDRPMRLNWLKRGALAALSTAVVAIFGFSVFASESRVDLKTFVARSYVEGIPYAEAKAYGVAATPALHEMLRDRSYTEAWANIVFILGCISDSSSVPPLTTFLQTLHGDISAPAFRAALGVLPALGQIAATGDRTAFSLLVSYTDPQHSVTAGPDFTFGRYKDATLGELLARTAIQGLGVSGTAEAEAILEAMHSDPTLRPDWRDNVDEALALNRHVQALGIERVLTEGDSK